MAVFAYDTRNFAKNMATTWCYLERYNTGQPFRLEQAAGAALTVVKQRLPPKPIAPRRLSVKPECRSVPFSR